MYFCILERWQIFNYFVINMVFYTHIRNFIVSMYNTLVFN